MVKNSLSLTLVMVSYVHLLTTLSLMVYLEFLILLPIYYLSINFVCKTMHFATLILLDSLFKIYLRGRSFTRICLPYSCTIFFALIQFYYLFYLTGSSVFTVFASSAQISLWHNRLGHQIAKLLHSTIQSVNPDFTFNKIDVCCSSCTSCISAKMHRLPLDKHEIQSTSMLQIVHFVVWGLAPISSLLEKTRFGVTLLEQEVWRT